MNIEYLLYGYGLVCLSMLVFNLVYTLHLRTGNHRLEKQVAALAKRVDAQLNYIQQNQPVQQRHLIWMRRRLSRVHWLLAFDRLWEDYDKGNATFLEYIIQFQPVFLYLATVYLKREETQAAYYCYFLSRHWNQRHRQMDQIQQVILSYLQKNSLYCRINALKALCAFGSPESLVSALLELGKGTESPLHEKVITEALLTYTGNCDDLIGRLWVRFDQFTLHIQRSILDYIRFQSGNYGPQLLQILQDPQQNKELRFAAIRYFGRYPDPGAKETLLAMIADQDPAHWEFAAISASSLARYPGQEVVDGLLHAMNSPNWYVRYNASASLEAHGLDYEQLLQVIAGEDRYAREMLVYRLETRRLEKTPLEWEAEGNEQQEKVAATL